MTKDIRFIILTPTYQRNDLLARAISSVRAQTYSNWLMYILNDSPSDNSYQEIESRQEILEEKRIIYQKNQKNIGKNLSLNCLLKKIKPIITANDFIIFLDDDDWLNPKGLEVASKIINSWPKENWFVSNRSWPDGSTITKVIDRNKINYNYLFDYLVTKKITGDATHIIKASVAIDCYLPRSGGSGEEWFFFSQIKPNNFIYYNFNTTYSDGYRAAGVTSTKTSWKRLIDTFYLFAESLSLKNPLRDKAKMLVYFGGRRILNSIRSLRELFYKRVGTENSKIDFYKSYQP